MSPLSRTRSRRAVTPELLALVADRFRALAEPARLLILHTLSDGERSVTALVDETGMAQANLSKHLQHLHLTGFLRRRREGLFVFYALADSGVLALCDIMCGRLESDLDTTQRLVRARSARRPVRG